MKPVFFAACLCCATAIAGTPHALTINGAGTTITCTTHNKTGADLATLFNGSNDTTTNGDDISCTPNGSVEWPTGNWAIVRSTTSADWWTFDGGGCTFTGQSNTNETGTINIRNGSGVLFKNAKLKNTHASGALGNTLVIQSKTAAMNDIIVRDVEILQPTYYAAYQSAPHILVEQENSPEYPITCTMERVVCELDVNTNLRPIMNTQDDGGTGMTARGRLHLVGCRFGGIGNDAGDAADDAVGGAASMDILAEGCYVHDVEAAGLTQVGGSVTYARLFAYNCVTERCNLSSVLAGLGSIVCTTAINCEARDCMIGFATAPWNPTFTTTAYEMATLKNCSATRTRSRFVSSGALYAMGVSVRNRNNLIEGCVFRGFDCRQSASSRDYGVNVTATAATMRGGCLDVRNCLFDSVRRGIVADTMCLSLNIDSCAYRWNGVYTPSDGQDYFTYFQGESSALKMAARMANNVSLFSASAAEAYYTVVPLQNITQITDGGFNYHWFSGTSAGVYESANVWSNYESDGPSGSGPATDVSTSGAANMPIFDNQVRQSVSSPAYGWGNSDTDLQWPGASTNGQKSFSLGKGTLIVPTNASGATDANTSLAYTPGTAIDATTLPGKTAIIYGGANGAVSVRRIKSWAANVMTLEMQLTNLDASTSLALDCITLPAIEPRNFDLTTAQCLGLSVVPSGNIPVLDAFGNFPQVRSTENVTVSSGIMSGMRRSPGPFSNSIPRTDYRVSAPWRGPLPGTNDARSAYRAK